MLNMTLRLTRPDDRTIVLRLPRLFRLIIGVAAGGLLIGMVDREGFAVAPFIVILLMGAAASYIERWTFSLREGTVTYRIGLPFAHRKESHPFSEIEAVGVSEFTKGKLFQHVGEREAGGAEGSRPHMGLFKRRYVRLSLYLSEGEELDIETQPVRGGRDLGERAEELSRFIGKPLRRE
ncbi:MAG: hypothetical protein ACOC47_07185 [Alkalispirochaetaceae bacterium]